MSKHSKKEFPSQTENRKQWILDTVRANQDFVSDILQSVMDDAQQYAVAKWTLNEMHKHDRDALLLPGGILTDEQIEVLKDE